MLTRFADVFEAYTNQEFVTSYLGDTKAAQEFCDELKTMDAWGSDENGNAKFEVCTLTNDVEIWYFDGYWTDSVEFAEDGTTEVVTRVPATITSTTETLSPRPTTSEEPLSDETAPDGAEAVDSGNSLADSSGSGKLEEAFLNEIYCRRLRSCALAGLMIGRDSSSNESSGADGSSMSADTITAESSESSKKGGGGGVLTIYSTQSVEGEKASSEQDIGGCGPEGIHGWAPAFLLSITFLRAVLLSA